MNNLTWVDITRKSIKSKLGFGCSVQGIEKQNKVKQKLFIDFLQGKEKQFLNQIDKLYFYLTKILKLIKL